MTGDERAAVVAEAAHRAFHEAWTMPEPLDLYADSPIWRAVAAAVIDALDAQPGDAEQADGLSEDERARIVAASLVDQTAGRNWHRTLTEVERILAARAAAPGADAVRALDEVERGLRQVSMPPEVREDAYRVLAEVRAAADTGGERGAGG